MELISNFAIIKESFKETMPATTDSHKTAVRISFLNNVKATLNRIGIDYAKLATSHIGIALSGGADSVALLSVCRELGCDITALHCNFHLRGDESNRDRQFVESLCRDLNIELNIIDFDVDTRRHTTGESIEMACRELRYEWFSKIANEKKLDFIALGHHRDDNVETFLLNALRGCGLAGVKGIPLHRDIFIRPLLFISREEILKYLDASDLSFVTDSTNAETEYGRNKIRNIILPELETQFPGATARLAATTATLADQYKLFQKLLQDKAKIYTGTNGEILLSKLLTEEEHETVATLLYHLLDGNLDRDHVERLIASSGNSGKIYEGHSGRNYMLDRGSLFPIDDNNITSTATWSFLLPRLNIEELKVYPKLIPIRENKLALEVRVISHDEFSPTRDNNYAWFDAERLSTAKILFRNPNVGDRIEPFGMNGSKLLSDIFSDNKLSLTDKKEIAVLTDETNIIWIPGLRTSRHYSVTDSTKNILELHILNIAKKS